MATRKIQRTVPVASTYELSYKRGPTVVKETEYGLRKPLVPDIPPEFKALIYEQLSKSLSEVHCRSQSAGSAVVVTEQLDISEIKRSESMSKKLSRKLKSLFVNDQLSTTGNQHLENSRPCAHLPFLQDDEKELYAHDRDAHPGRTRDRWSLRGA